MKRMLVVLLVLGLAAMAGYGVLHRPAHATPPADLDPVPFRVEPSGQGTAIRFEPDGIPLRRLAWSRPLPGGLVVAQVLSQANRQQAFLFRQGALVATLSLERPKDVAENVFGFAELCDAACLPDQTVLLLYRTSRPEAPALLLAWDLTRKALLWDVQGKGDRIRLSQDGQWAYLYGGDAPIQRLSILRKDGSLAPGPDPKPLDFPAGWSRISDLLPGSGPDLLLASPEGLAAWTDGTWSMTASPAPAALGFPAGQGVLVRAGATAWWQPEPGRLFQVTQGSAAPIAQDLAPLLTGAHAQDAALLRLLGADPDGTLWFTPEAPTFQPSSLPAPDAPPMIPPPVSSSGAAPVPAGTGRETWDPYLKAGLRRLWTWKPGAPAMSEIALPADWNQLGAPAGLVSTQIDSALTPAAGGALLGGQDLRWWLPLRAVAGLRSGS